MKPDGDPNESPPPEESSESVPEAGVSRLQRLKRFILAAYLRVIDALSGVLNRLRNRVGKLKEEDGEKEERSESRAPERKAKTPHADEAPVATPPAPRSAVRSFFIYLLVLVIGIIAGMTFSFALLSNMVINQAQKIEDQRDEISQLEKQYSSARESEAKYRNRLSETETQLRQLTEKMSKTAPPESGSSPAPTKEKPEKPPAPVKTGNCNVESGNAEELARCIDEFNRKASQGRR